MKKTMSIKIATLFMAMVMLFMSAGTTTAFAAGNDYFPKNEWHDVTGFTFTNDNTTPWKTVDSSATKMYLHLGFKKADGTNINNTNPKRITDAGQGRLRLLVYVEREGQSGRELIFSCPTNQNNSIFDDYSLDFNVNPGQRIRFYFDAVSEDGSNGHYRSCNVTTFEGYAH